MPLSVAATISIVASWTSEEPASFRETEAMIIRMTTKVKIVIVPGRNTWEMKSKTTEVRAPRQAEWRGVSAEELKVLSRRLVERRARNR